jgi:hypothetical protein
MLQILLVSSLTIILFLVAGVPITALSFLSRKANNQISWITFLALSIVIGFGICGFSISSAYGFLGINNYFPILICLSAISWGLLFFFRKQVKMPYKDKNSYLFLLPSILLSLFFVRSQWDSSLKPIIKSGTGPDVSQNLMAAQIAQELGSTWSMASNNLINALGVDNLQQAAIDIFRIPSFKEVAGYDYLVFGGRWGLTVFYNELTRFIGPQAVMWEIGIILFTSLVSLSIIFFACSKLLTKSNAISCGITLSLIGNASLLFQYYNGGISQIFGIIGVSGILLTLILINDSGTYLEKHIQKIGIFFLATASWIGSAITYVDATFIIILLILVLLVITAFTARELAKKIYKYLILPGVAAVILMPSFVYAILASLSYRSAAANGTGTTSGVWKTPSQLMGIFNVFSISNDSQSKFTFYLSVIITVLIVIFILSTLLHKDSKHLLVTNLALSSIIVIAIGLVLSVYSNNRSDYIYNKITNYVVPFLVFSILVLIPIRFNGKAINSVARILLVMFPLTMVSSALIFENKLYKSSETVIIPNVYSNLITNSYLQEYLKSHNYLQPYRAAYSFSGILGAEYWVTKAPNDMKLDSRMAYELRLFCFLGDQGCNPKNEKITNTELEKFGIIEYKSTLTTNDFQKLSPLERFNYNFDSFGMPRDKVPSKFIGGNPYLN